MLPKITFWLLVLAFSGYSQQVFYEVSAPNAIHNEAEIKITLAGVKSDTVKMLMSRSSPGRYALFEFSHNVYNVKAADSHGNALPISPEGLNSWKIKGCRDTVIFSYTLYANLGDGTFSQVNDGHIHLNIPSAFMWAEGYDTLPLQVKFSIPQDKKWSIATQLKPVDNQYLFSAPNMYFFMDSPVEIAPLDFREWNVSANGKTYKMRLAVHQNEDKEYVDILAHYARMIVPEAEAVWNEYPVYDFGTYTFLCDYVSYADNDGMEHRNSTYCTGPKPLSVNMQDVCFTIAHEYFHCWNVERLRPRSLEPFDFLKENVSGELWFAEGFTSYYETIIPYRAGIIDLKSFCANTEKYLDPVINSPGRRFFSPVDMSRQAPFVDAAVSVDPQNKINTFISYYDYGAALGLALDLSIRKNFPGLSLDNYMRLMWQKFGKTEIPYTLNDLQKTLSECTTTAFADSFFNKYIYKSELPDFNRLFSSAGFIIKKAREGKASFGKIRLKEDSLGVKISSPSVIGSSLYKAGIDMYDIIYKIGDDEVKTQIDIAEILDKYAPGEKTTIEYFHLGQRKTAEVTFQESKQFEVIPYEDASMDLTNEMKNFRREWLESKAK